MVEVIQEKSIKGKGLMSERKNELIHIQETLETAFNESKKLTEQVNRQHPYVMEQCVVNLLCRSGENGEHVAKLHQVMNEPLDRPYYFVLLVTFVSKKNQAVQSNQLVLEQFRCRKLEGAVIVAAELFHDKAIACLINMDTTMPPVEASRTIVEKMEKAIKKRSRHRSFYRGRNGVQ